MRGAEEVSGQRHATGLERTQVKFLPAAEDGGAEKPCPRGKRVQPPVEEAGFLCPPQEVSPPKRLRAQGALPQASTTSQPASLSSSAI